jgi:membrane associated rhomboid family serine protease
MMQQDNTIEIFFYSAMPILSLSFLLFTFAAKNHHASRWLRNIAVILAILGPIWSGLGFLLLFYSEHFTRHTLGYLFQWKSHLGGIAIGLLTSLILSPEFPQLARAGRRSEQQGLTNR